MKLRKRAVQILISCCLGISLILFSAFSSFLLDQPDPADANIPFLSEACGESAEAQFPKQPFNWSQWNWSSFPPAEQGDYSGRTITQIITLGGQQGVFNAQNKTLSEINALAGKDINTIRLSDLGLLSWQSIGNLAKAVPGLGNRRATEIPLINELLKDRVNALERVLSLNDLLAQRPDIAKLVPGEDLLHKYGLSGLPNIGNTALTSFQDWHKSAISQVPGLEQVPFSEMVDNSSPLATLMPVAIMDIPLGGTSGSQESDRCRTVTGSGPLNFSEPCGSGCDHVELSDPVLGNTPLPTRYAGVHGRQFILASTDGSFRNWVEGGSGAPACKFLSVPPGKEPTGRMLVPGLAKLVLTSVDEKQGAAQFSLYFGYSCTLLGVPIGHTPYFIGPIPLPLPTPYEKDTIPIGFGFDLPNPAGTAL